MTLIYAVVLDGKYVPVEHISFEPSRSGPIRRSVAVGHEQAEKNAILNFNI